VDTYVGMLQRQYVAVASYIRAATRPLEGESAGNKQSRRQHVCCLLHAARARGARGGGAVTLACVYGLCCCCCALCALSVLCCAKCGKCGGNVRAGAAPALQMWEHMLMWYATASVSSICSTILDRLILTPRNSPVPLLPLLLSSTPRKVAS
jgi:hypothetical protein